MIIPKVSLLPLHIWITAVTPSSLKLCNYYTIDNALNPKLKEVAQSLIQLVFSEFDIIMMPHISSVWGADETVKLLKHFILFILFV